LEHLLKIKYLNYDGLQLYNTYIELDCKRAIDGLYSKRISTSDLSAILSDCRTLLATNIVNFHVKFIMRQTNKVAHNLIWMVTFLALFHNFIDISTCIYDIIVNEMR
jgi:hypothetical protein